jgi:long-chain fatty acid transport protein
MDPSFFDADNIELAGGARVLVANFFYLAASYTHLFYFDRDNTGKSDLAAASVPTQQQDGGGKYTQWVGFFDLNVEKTF